MKQYFPGYFIVGLFIFLAACGGKNNKSTGTEATTDTAAVKPVENNAQTTDNTLNPVKSFIEKDLAEWGRSFKNFNIDSFRFYQRDSFPDLEYQEQPDAKFYDLYKASLSYSPDSSQFIDLYSYGLSLEKKGKRIIATADVDNGVTLCDLKNKTWKRIAFFGPSAWIEEAIWTSPSTFILAGVGPGDNDEGDPVAFMMLGDTKDKTFRWYQSKAVRPQSAKYEASGMKKLKIDAWDE